MILLQLLIEFQYNNNLWSTFLVPIITLIISACILFLGIKSYLSFIKNRLSTKQLDIVTDLIRKIHDSPIDLNFSIITGKSGHGALYPGTLFEIKNIGNDDLEIEEFEDKPVIFKGNCNQVIDFYNFIDNPLTPKSIADELLKFYSYTHELVYPYNNEPNVTLRYVVMKTNVFIETYKCKETKDSTLYYYGDAFALSTWLNLKECCKQLEGKIVLWLNSKGINEINIRSNDYKTPSSFHELFH